MSTSEPEVVRVRRRHRRSTTLGIWAIAGASAIGAALSPAQPVGLRAADAIWCAALGLFVPLIASRSRRSPLLWFGGVSAVMGIGGDLTAKAFTVALLVVIGLVVFSDRRDRVVAAAIGGLSVQAMLRGPSFGFVGLPTIIAVAALAPMCWSAYRMARRRERRVALVTVLATTAFATLFGGLAIVGALQTRSTLEDGADQAVSALDSLRIGDTAGAADRFTAASATFDDASASLEGWTTWGGRFVPVVGQHVEALRRVASAGSALGESAATTASSADYRTLTSVDGRVDLQQIEALQDPVAESAAVATAALDSVEAVTSPWLVGPVAKELRRFDEKLTDAGEQAEIAAGALAVAPEILGADGPRRYFVSFATPGEARNGGGFAGAYGLLVADQGKLSLLNSGNLNGLNPVGAPYAFDPPPDWEQRYGGYNVRYFLGNHTASPDWPTDRGVISQLFPQAPGGVQIDGAIYVDPAAIAGFLQLTGPIAIPELGVTLDPGNAERFLLQDQYVLIDGNNPLRKEYLGDAARATFDALTSRELPGVSTLTDVLGPLVAGGHLRLSVADEAAESFLDRVGLSGVWDPAPGADYVSLRWSNQLPNKIDSFIHRDIEVISTVDESTGKVDQKITVVVRNDAPPSGLPSYVIGNTAGLPEGTSRDVLALYSPHALDTVTIDGVPARATTQVEFGRPVYPLTVEVPPGTSRIVVFTLSGRMPSRPYRLNLIPQAMANPDALTVSIVGSRGISPAPQYDGPFRQPLVIGG